MEQALSWEKEKKFQESYPEINSLIELSRLEVGTVARIPVKFIISNPDQPRKFFPNEEVRNRADSMRDKQDVEDPIHVSIRKGPTGFFALIHDGEIRWRAAKELGLQHLSCLVKPKLSKDDLFLSSAKANWNKLSMSAIEDANIVCELEKRFGWNQQEIANHMGKSQSFVAQCYKFMRLHEDIQAAVLFRQIEKGNALLFASWKPEDQPALYAFFEDFMKKRRNKSIHPNEANMIIRREAERRGLELLIPSKRRRGRKTYSYAELVMRKTLRDNRTLRKDIGDVLSLTDAQIADSGTHILDILAEVENTKKSLEMFYERINKMD